MQPENIVYSDYTSAELYRAGASRGAIDPVLPGEDRHLARLQPDSGQAPQEAARRDLLPDVSTCCTSPLVKLTGTNACPTVTATPETVKAAFTKENNVFAEINVKYIDPILNFADRKLFAHQMFDAWKDCSGLSQEENDRAIEVGLQGA